MPQPVVKPDCVYVFDEPPGQAYEIRVTVVPKGQPHKGAIWYHQTTPADPTDLRAALADFLQTLHAIPEQTDAPKTL